MSKDTDELKIGNAQLQNAFLSTSKTIEDPKKAIHEQPEQLYKDQHMEPILKEKETELAVEGGAIRRDDSTAVPRALGSQVRVRLPPDAPGCLKLMDATQGRLFSTVMALGKALDHKAKAMFPSQTPQALRVKEWNHFISKIIPHGYRFDTSPNFRHVWCHWICTITFHDFESVSFGMNEVPSYEPDLLKIDPTRKKCNTKENVFEGCSTFQAFVKRKYHSLCPDPVQGFLDEDIYTKFTAVAEKAWKLHQVGLRCDPPASIFLPVPIGTQYNPQHHIVLNHQQPDGEIMLTVLPGFRVRDHVFRSKVILKQLKR